MDQSWVSPALTSGLGNRLFQFAAAAGAAERWGRPVVFYLPAMRESPHGRIGTMFDLFPDVPVVEDSATDEFLLQEPARQHYRYLGLGVSAPHPTKCVVLRGYWQSPRYFPSLGLPQPNWGPVLGV